MDKTTSKRAYDHAVSRIIWRAGQLKFSTMEIRQLSELLVIPQSCSKKVLMDRTRNLTKLLGYSDELFRENIEFLVVPDDAKYVNPASDDIPLIFRQRRQIFIKDYNYRPANEGEIWIQPVDNATVIQSIKQFQLDYTKLQQLLLDNDLRL